MRNGYFLGNALDRTQDIEGEEDEIPDLDILYAPFTIYHKQGSVRTFLVFHSFFPLKGETKYIII